MAIRTIYMRKTRKKTIRRDRRLAKASGWKRLPKSSTKIGHGSGLTQGFVFYRFWRSSKTKKHNSTYKYRKNLNFTLAQCLGQDQLQDLYLSIEGPGRYGWLGSIEQAIVVPAARVWIYASTRCGSLWSRLTNRLPLLLKTIPVDKTL